MDYLKIRAFVVADVVDSFYFIPELIVSLIHSRQISIYIYTNISDTYVQNISHIPSGTYDLFYPFACYSLKSSL